MYNNSIKLVDNTISFYSSELVGPISWSSSKLSWDAFHGLAVASPQTQSELYPNSKHQPRGKENQNQNTQIWKTIFKNIFIFKSWFLVKNLLIINSILTFVWSECLHFFYLILKQTRYQYLSVNYELKIAQCANYA